MSGVNGHRRSSRHVCWRRSWARLPHAQQGAPPPAVLVQPAELTPIADQLEFIGRAAAVDKVELRARVKGFLGPRKFNDGDQVKKDEVVFTIEPETYQAAVDQKIAQRDCRPGRAHQRRSAAPARRPSCCAPTPARRRTYDQRLSEQLQAKAQLEDAKAQLRDAEIQLSYTEIKSPIAGRIGRAAVSPGNLVSPDSGVLATVVSETPIRVLFPVTQRELLEAKRDASIGDPPAVRLKLADGSLYKEKGKLDFIDITVDPKTDGQIVRATFDNKDNLLTDGQTVRVILEDNKPKTVVTVPQQAIALDQTGPYLFVVDDKNVVAAAAGEDRHRAQRPAGHHRRAEGGRQGHRPGPAAHPRRHDRGAQRGRTRGRQAEAVAP